MRKDTRLSFRVGSELKKTLEAVAALEGRSVAQVCEVFLRAGSEVYKNEGTKLIQRFLTQQKAKRKGTCATHVRSSGTR
jgi:hypothetical protein